MEFTINGEKWRIERLNSKDMLNEYYENNKEKTSFVFGLCDYRYHVVYINMDCCVDQQIATLKHELAHVWIFMIGIYFAEANEEVICDIVARSNKFINEVVNIFEKELKNGETVEVLSNLQA